MARLFSLFAPTLLLAAANAGVAVAQHAQGWVADPNQTECNLCHGSHQGAPGAYNLKVDNIKVWMRGDMAGEPGAVSYSCLRCHAAASLRERQPEFATSPPETVREGSYVGIDLSTHHPLGRLTEEQRERQNGTRVTAHVAQPFLADHPDDAVECTSCHDPHDRGGSSVAEQHEVALCSECHDPTVFLLSHERLTCSSCHRLHQHSNVGALLSSGMPGAVCRSCHSGVLQSPDPDDHRRVSRAAALTAPMAHMDDPTVAQRDCTTCHAVHQEPL